MSHQLHILRTRKGAFRNFTYLLVDGRSRHAALIDPAWELDVVVAGLARAGAELKTVLLTHSHFDHVNLVPELARRYAPAVYMHRREIEAYGYACPGLRPVDDLQSLELGDTRIDCLHTPGHTAGGACFLLEDALFSGDTVFTEGCGLCNGAGGCPHAMFRSMQRIKRIVDPGVRVYPGHSFGKEPGMDLAHLIRNNIYFQIEDESDFVAFRMRHGRRILASHFDFR